MTGSLAGWHSTRANRGFSGQPDLYCGSTYSTCQSMIFLFATLPGSFVSIASSTGLWRRTLRIPKRAICSGSSLRERNWTGSSQLAWPLLHILDGQMLDWQCLVACMHAKKLGRPRRIWGSEEHPTAPVAQRMQRRRQPAHSGRKRNALNGVAPVTWSLDLQIACLRVPANAMLPVQWRMQDSTGCPIVKNTGLRMSDRIYTMSPSDSVIKKVESQSTFGKEPSQPRKKQRRHTKSK